jgi:SAM-dependent methyltransferase
MSIETPHVPNFAPDADAAYTGTEELWANEKHLRQYNIDIVNKLAHHFNDARDVLEFGSGIGTLALLWHEINGIKPECLEVDKTLRREVTQRGFHCYDSVAAITKSFDGIYTSNVLEHIEDDVATLKQLHTMLNPGACLSIYVPAFNCLYAKLDAYLGHFRRYSRSEMLRKLAEAQFEIVECRYVDCIGFFAWWLVKMRGQRPDNKFVSAGSLKFYDRFIYPMSKFLDDLGLKHVFGKNLLVIARKTELNKTTS